MIGHPLTRQVPFGRTTQRFFVEGEQHEAQQWQDVALPPDDEPEPKRQRGRIDKVPRQRGAMLMLALFGICLIVGLGVGISALLKTGNRLDTFLSLFKASPPPMATSEQAQPVTAKEPAQTHAQVAPIASEPAQTVPATTAPTPSAVSQTSQDPSPRQAGVTTVEQKGPESGEVKSESTIKHRRHHARHSEDNYIWSQELNALVPVSSMAEPDPSVAAPPSDSARKEPSRSERSDPFEPNALAPPRLHPSTIAPATTGSPTPERTAPNADKDFDPFQK